MICLHVCLYARVNMTNVKYSSEMQINYRPGETNLNIEVYASFTHRGRLYNYYDILD